MNEHQNTALISSSLSSAGSPTKLRMAGLSLFWKRLMGRELLSDGRDSHALSHERPKGLKALTGDRIR